MNQGAVGMNPVVAILSAAVAIVIPVIAVALVRKWRLVKTSEDYFVAGRSAHWALAMASVASMFIWGSSVMGAAEGAANNGLSGVWIYPMYAVGLWVFGIWASKLRDIFPFAISYTEYFRHRFDKKTHILLLFAAIATSFSGAWCQGLAGGHVMEGLTLGAVPYWVGVLFLGFAVLIYSVVAGLWGSLISTWLFSLITMPICAIVGVAAWWAIGGPVPIIETAQSLFDQGKLGSEMFTFFRPDALVNYLIPVLAWALFSLPMQQDFWQTAFAVKNKHEVGKAFRHAGNWWFFMPLISGSVGFAGLILMKSGAMAEVAPSQVYPALVGQFLPMGFEILFILLIFSATVGTVGAAMIAIGNMISHDIYKGYINPNATDDQIKKVARWIVLFATVGVIAVSLLKLSILLVLLFMPMYCAPFVWGFIHSQYSKRISAWPFFIGGLIGFAIGTYMFLGLGMWGWAMIAAFGSAAVVVLVGSAIAPDDFDFDILKRRT